MTRLSIGDRELALLRYIDKRGNSSVGESGIEFGSPRGLARSTVLTMMERLRAKGFLKRRRVQGVYRYSAATATGETMRRVVGRFVEKTLGGSISPFVAWMAERGELTESELEELKSLVTRFEGDRNEN